MEDADKLLINYTITPEMAQSLMRIEAAKQAITDLPITPMLLAQLRETAKLYSTHYSTKIEGNRLTQEEVENVIEHKGHFPGRERDEAEILGYYRALEYVLQLTAKQATITESVIQTLHALVMKQKGKTPYRDGQNVIRESASGQIVYLPPEAHDVSPLMKQLIQWIQEQKNLPFPLVAAIAHYQFATIHPYYDGNGRCARLLTTLILHISGYDLKGIYCLEEYYAKNLSLYYEALSVGPSHNYYMGRAEADITQWIEYFCLGMAIACENIKTKAATIPTKDLSPFLRQLDPKKKRALELFESSTVISSKDVATLFGLRPRTASSLCAKWVSEGFLTIDNPSNKGRTYRLASRFSHLIT